MLLAVASLLVQEGAIDEVSFGAPELGPLAALIVGPEQGRWLCEEVDVSSSRTGHTDRHACGVLARVAVVLRLEVCCWDLPGPAAAVRVCVCIC